MDIFLYKTFDGNLVPADDGDRELMKKIKNGSIVKAKVTVPRNYENHKRFFSFIRTIFEMQEQFDTEEHLRKWLIMKAGWYETIVAPNGNTIFLPQSIAFEKMEEEEFQRLFSACIDVFLKELSTGITEEELRRVVEYS